MQIDLEKELNLADWFDEIIRLSEDHLDADSIHILRHHFDDALIYVEDEESKEVGKLIDLLNNIILNSPKRIDRLVELEAPQVIINREKSVLESVKKIKSNLL